MNISVEIGFNHLRIKFEGITHFRLDVTKYIAHQSWRDGYGNRKFVIEYAVVGRDTPILCEYDSEEKWTTILSGLDIALDGPFRKDRIAQ